MKFKDYSIELGEFEANELISEWNWVVPSDSKVVALTKFGDWFLILDDGRMVFLDILDGSLSDVGLLSASDFSNDEVVENLGEQFSIGWTEICTQRNLHLAPGQCYGWKIHPIIGGKFEFDNIGIFSLTVYESMTGQIVRQIKDNLQGHRISGIAIQPPL